MASAPSLDLTTLFEAHDAHTDSRTAALSRLFVAVFPRSTWFAVGRGGGGGGGGAKERAARTCVRCCAPALLRIRSCGSVCESPACQRGSSNLEHMVSLMNWEEVGMLNLAVWALIGKTGRHTRAHAHTHPRTHTRTHAPTHPHTHTPEPSGVHGDGPWGAAGHARTQGLLRGGGSPLTAPPPPI